MTLRAGYEIGFALACTNALLIVLLGGELPALGWMAVLVVWAATWLRINGRTAPSWVGTGLGFAALIAGASIVLIRGAETLVLGATIGIVGLLVGRVLTRTELGHDLQALLLTLLLVFAGAGLNTSISYGVVFAGYAITVIWALVTRQLVDGAHREASRRGGAAVETTLARRDVVTPTFFGVSALLSLIVLAGTLVLFIAFPRVGLGTFGMKMGARRLPDSVSLSSPPRAGLSSAVVARLQGLTETDYNRGLYLRAATYDRLTTRGFDRAPDTRSLGSRAVQRMARVSDERSYQVFLQPVTGRRLLTLGPMNEMRILSGGAANPSRRVRIEGSEPSGDVYLLNPLTGPIRYRITGQVNVAVPPDPVAAPAPVSKEKFAAWLELPLEVDPRVVELARSTIGARETAYQKANSLRQFFFREFDYTLSQPTAGTDDPLTEFILEARAGHCEHFATAFATMLRAVGVPARVVGGFQGGVWDDSSSTVVFRLNHAHAWVEWYQPGRGWVTDDATPPFVGDSLNDFDEMMERIRRVWDDSIIDYGLFDQIEVARKIGRQFESLPVTLNLNKRALRVGVIVLVMVALGAMLFYLRIRRRSPTKDDRLAAAIQDALEVERAAPLNPSMTFHEALETLSDSSSKRRQLLQKCIDTYERRRFGRAELGLEEEQRLIDLLGEPSVERSMKAA